MPESLQIVGGCPAIVKLQQGTQGIGVMIAETRQFAAAHQVPPDRFDFQILTLDRVTSGDFSIETEVQAERGKVNFCGLVFGRKGSENFHALMLFPGVDKKDGTSGSGFVDLATSFGSSVWSL